MVMIATGRYKRCAVSEPHDLIEPEDAGVERQGSIDVADFQVHMPDRSC